MSFIAEPRNICSTKLKETKAVKESDITFAVESVLVTRHKLMKY